jgi:hypothetical protein
LAIVTAKVANGSLTESPNPWSVAQTGIGFKTLISHITYAIRPSVPQAGLCYNGGPPIISPRLDFYVSTFFAIENIRYRFKNNLPHITPTPSPRSRSTVIEYGRSKVQGFKAE